MIQRKEVFVLFVLATTITNILSLAIPIVLMQTYDRTLRNGSNETHLALIIGGVLAVLLETMVKMAKENMINKYAAEFEIVKGGQLIEKILYGESKKLNSMTVGGLIDSFNSISKVKNLVSGKIVNTLLDLPFVFIFLLIIAKLNIYISLYLLAVFGSYVLIAVFHKKRFQHFNSAKKQVDDEKTSFFVDILSKISTVKSMTYEERLIRKNEFFEQQNTEKTILIKSYDLVPDSLGVLYSQIVLFGILGIGAYFVISNEMSIGVLTACVLLGNRFFQPVQGFISFYFNLTGHQLAYQNIDDVLSIKDENNQNLPDIPEEMDGSIQLRNVVVVDEGVEIINDVTFDFEAKNLYFLKGEDENAISSLMRSILGHIDFQQGKILFDNYDSSGFNHYSIQRLIGYVPQKSELFNGTVLENITMFESNKSQVALDIGAMLGLDSIVSKMPNGYDTEISSRSSKVMPGGLVLRIILARILMRHPKVLILDRCYHSMDHDAQQVLLWLLNKLKGKMTIIFIAKFLPDSLNWDYVVNLENGKLDMVEKKEAA